MFFLHLANHPIWLSSDSPIHIETREHVMNDRFVHLDKGV